MIKKLIGNKIVKNAGWLIGGKIAQMVISLFIGLLTARYLGPSNFGLINYAAAYTNFFIALCNLGINSVMVKELIDNPEQEQTVLGTSILLKMISSALSALTIIGIVFFVDAGEPTTIAVVALSTLGMFFHLFDTFNYWFQSKLQSKVTAISTLIAYSVTAVYRVVLLAVNADVTMFALATSVDYVCLAVLLWLAYKKHGGLALKFSKTYAKHLLSRSVHFILPSVMVAIYAQTDRIMLKHLYGQAELGYYSTASSLSIMWCFVLQAIIDSIYPMIAKAWNEERHTFNKRNKQLYAIVFYLSFFVSCLFTVFAKPIVGILYGEEFMPAVAPLRIITWYTAFSYLGVARNAWVVCKERQKYLIYVYVSAAVTNVLLNLIFIPQWGASGAAVASLISQIVTTMIAPFFIKELRENSVLMLEAIVFKGLK